MAERGKVIGAYAEPVLLPPDGENHFQTYANFCCVWFHILLRLLQHAFIPYNPMLTLSHQVPWEFYCCCKAECFVWPAQENIKQLLLSSSTSFRQAHHVFKWNSPLWRVIAVHVLYSILEHITLQPRLNAIQQSEYSKSKCACPVREAPHPYRFVRGCEVQEESLFHILREFDALPGVRQRVLGHGYPGAANIIDIKLGALLIFCLSAGYMWAAANGWGQNLESQLV